jgi:hypothetical protein
MKATETVLQKIENARQFEAKALSLVSVAKLVDFVLGQVSYTDFIGITVLPCG